jgi:DNA mismatch endonuclease, patch repair protein
MYTPRNKTKSRTYIRDGRAPIPQSEATSRVMSSNKGKNTKLEKKFREALLRADMRGYRLNLARLPGRPDICFTKKKVAIFINGCFWHRCPHCNLPLPNDNTEFWENKFNSNVERDKKKKEQLLQMGWKVIVIWECQIKNDLDSSLNQVKMALK